MKYEFKITQTAGFGCHTNDELKMGLISTERRDALVNMGFEIPCWVIVIDDIPDSDVIYVEFGV